MDDRQRDYAHQFGVALIWVVLASAAFLLWKLRVGIVVAFAAVLAALVFRSIASWVARKLKIPIRHGLLIAIVLVVALIGGSLSLFGAQIAGQVGDVVHRLQQSAEAVDNSIPKANGLIRSIGQSGAASLTGWLSAAMSSGFSVVEATVVMVVMSIYLAADPELYRVGLLKLLPSSSQPRAEEGLDRLERALVLWLLGQVILMVVVGVLSFIALRIIGVPSAIGLSLIAGVTEIVPYVGPFIGAVPAVVIALSLGLGQVAWVIVAYILIHVTEGYFLAPMIQRRFVDLPPALVLLSIVLSELLFGVMGLLVATPLAIVLFVAARTFYVRDVLHRKVEEPPGLDPRADP